MPALIRIVLALLTVPLLASCNESYADSGPPLSSSQAQVARLRANAAAMLRHRCLGANGVNEMPPELVGHYYAEFRSDTTPRIGAFVLLQERGTLSALTSQNQTALRENAAAVLGTWRTCSGVMEIHWVFPLMAAAGEVAAESPLVFGGVERLSARLEQDSDGRWTGPAILTRLKLAGDPACLGSQRNAPCLTAMNLGTITLAPAEAAVAAAAAPVVTLGPFLGTLAPDTTRPGYYILTMDDGTRLWLNGFTVPGLPVSGAQVTYGYSTVGYIDDTPEYGSVSVSYNGHFYEDDTPERF